MAEDRAKIITVLLYQYSVIVKGMERKLKDLGYTFDNAQQALDDYYDYGNTSQYYSADITLLNQDNVSDFLKKEDGDE